MPSAGAPRKAALELLCERPDWLSYRGRHAERACYGRLFGVANLLVRGRGVPASGCSTAWPSTLATFFLLAVFLTAFLAAFFGGDAPPAGSSNSAGEAALGRAWLAAFDSGCAWGGGLSTFAAEAGSA